MDGRLTTDELVDLVRRVFRPRPGDRGLLVLTDLPDDAAGDHGRWAWRRAMAGDWAARLAAARSQLGIEEVQLALYRNVRRHNQDLPATARLHRGGPLPATAASPAADEAPFADLFEQHRIVVAPTEFSATAPLKLEAARRGLRAATMPGFTEDMLPTLRLDWVEIDGRCRALKERLDAAEEARLVFDAAGTRCELTLDLRGRLAHASGGLLVEPGVAGNLPSGETYIVPYEGERAQDPSRSRGRLPLELAGELLTLRIEGNQVIEVIGEGPAAAAERRELSAEPAYGNVAELGLGILRGYGIRPVGELLLDEKLGLHIAFGRSDHFGGQVGPRNWRDAARVVHLDRVFIPEVMPRVRVQSVDLAFPDGALRPLIRADQYV